MKYEEFKKYDFTGNYNIPDQIAENGVSSHSIESDVLNTYKKDTRVEFAPMEFIEAKDIANELLINNEVVIKLKDLVNSVNGRFIAERIIDYVCGVAYAIKAHVRKIDDTTFYIVR